MDNNQWHWQESGKAWKGVGIYHITMVVPSREPLLGELIIPDNDPKQARVERTELGKAIVHILAQISVRHPEVRLLQYCLMPDHVHAVLYVTREMPVGIGTVVRGFWQGAKKIGREFSLKVLSVNADNIRDNEQNCNPISDNEQNRNLIRDNEQNHSSTSDNEQAPNSIFTEKPFIRPLSHRGQLNAMMRYVKMNPQRLATKRLMPGYFRVQEGIEIAGCTYRGVGNIALLQAERYAPVHVRRTIVEEAEHGDNTRLRDYMNGCVLAARKGTVMVSPFISQQEKAVMDILIKEKHPFIYIADNGFRDYYKPSDGLFDAVAEGRVLILSPWEYDAGKKHVTRAECVEMNRMAEDICAQMTMPE